MSETPVNWETFRTNIFTDQKARDSGITTQDWKDAMNQLGLERIALQEADEWHDEVGGELVTYEFSRTVGQPGVIIIEAACYAAWRGAKKEVYTDHEILLGQAFIECALTDPDTFEHVRDRDPDAPDATLEVFLNHKNQDTEYQHGDDAEYLETVLVRLNTASESAPDFRRLLRAVAQWAETRAEDTRNGPAGPDGEALPRTFTMGARPSQDPSAGTNKA